MANKNPSRALVTPEFRMSYPALVTPKPFMENGRPTGDESYQVEAIFDEAALDHFRIYDEATNGYVEVNLLTVLAQLAKEAWPSDNIKTMFESQKDKHGQPNKGWPVKRGDVIKAQKEAKGKQADHYAGTRVIALNAKTKTKAGEPLQPPTISMVTGDKTFKTFDRLVDTDMAKARAVFSGGNYAFATVGFVAMKVAGVAFIAPYLNGIRYTRSGKSLGGQSDMDRFDGYTGGASDHNPTAGMNDEIPF
jgi:hypothetical protein